MFNRFSRIFVYTAIVLFSFCSFVNASTIKFAQISDIHYQPNAPENSPSFKMKYYSKALLDDAIHQINAEKGTDFILVTGDAADRPRKSDFETVYRMMNEFNRPWYYCLGNHDNAVKGKFTKAEQIKLLQAINPKGFSPDKTYYSFVPKRGFVFIGLDATYDTKVTSHGYIPPKQIEYTEKLIKDAGACKVIVIFLHHPTTYPMAGTDHTIINDKAFKKMLKKYKNPILILGGHYHGTKIEREGNIIHVASPALVSYPCAFRIITIKNTRQKVTFLFEYRETKLKDVQRKAKARMIGGEKATHGTEADRNTVIEIDKCR